MTELPEKIKRLQVSIGAADQFANSGGELIKDSIYSFRYAHDGADQPALSLLMPPTTVQHDDGDLFPVLDQNLPEGFLLQRVLELFPKRKLNKMHLLALMGDSGIGRVGFLPPGDSSAPRLQTLSRESILRTPMTPQLFDELVRTYLGRGTGVSGVQPKIMLPSRASVPIPDLIVKTAGAAYPGLAVNEFLCLSAAAKAEIPVPGFDLSDDGKVLVVDRFDIGADGSRFGFEDIAALKGERVNDRLDNRKYVGSYESVAEQISLFASSRGSDLARFFEQLAFSVMVRNGDAHLKNFGMLYDGPGESEVQLSPMYDVVTTTIYTYERPGGFEDVDRTMALKLWKGKHAGRAYPGVEELLRFGREICYVQQPERVIQRIAGAMASTLAEAAADPRVDRETLAAMRQEWEIGMGYTLKPSATRKMRPGK
jgi:serine/threonine-protein kinase HipA